MTVDLVIFDCDGVLIDSEPLDFRAVAECLAEDGIPLFAIAGWAMIRGCATRVLPS